VLESVLESLGRKAVVSFSKTSGRFNDAYRSRWYRNGLVLLFVWNVGVFTHAIFRLMWTVMTGNFIWNTYSVLFVCCLVLQIVFCAEMLLTVRAWSWSILQMITGTCYSLCFYIILKVWMNMLNIKRLAVSVMAFSYALNLAIVLAMAYLVYRTATLCGFLRGIPETIINVVLVTMDLPVQMITAIIFIVCLVKFYRSHNMMECSEETRVTTTRLMWLSAAGSFTIIVLSMLTFLQPRLEVSDSALLCLLATIAMYVNTTIRGTALLLLLRLD